MEENSHSVPNKPPFGLRRSDYRLAGRGAAPGFTMTELMTAITFLLIVIAISIPSIETAIQSYRAGADARSIASQLTLARMRAASDFTKTELAIATASNYYDVQVFNASAGVYQVEGGVQYLSQGTTFTYGTITVPAGEQTSIQQTTPITFNSRGLPVDSTGTPTANNAVYVGNSGQYYAVTVSLTGAVTVWQWSNTGWMAR